MSTKCRVILCLMIEQGQRLTHGTDPRLFTLQRRVEEVEVDPLYALVAAFDHEARQILLIPYEEGVVTLQGQAPLSGRFQEISEYVSSIHKRRLLYLYKAFSLVLTDGSTIEIEQSVWQ